MDCCVKWGSQLEKLADGLYASWQDTVRKAADPFGKVCVVVNDSATENWLKQYFLLDRKIPQIMMNLEFVRLPEFINDWLSAELYGITPWQRQASIHPYSTNVLTWRIYRILLHADLNGDLKELLEYIGEGKRKHLKRLALSEKLAVLYDDYLNSRSQMLRNWEKGVLKGNEDAPLWQIRLYQELVSEDSRTYAADYETIFRPETDSRIAFEYGFPRYLAVHVFDIPFMPETMLHLLEKISEAFPQKMTFWNFNPHNEWFGESSSKKEMIRKIREKFRKQRDMLHSGTNPAEDSRISIMEGGFASSEERLFGALASGARAMICNLCKDSDGRVDAIGDPGLACLKRQNIFLHNCYSPRRELETIKDGLLQFFDENPGMHPHDAVVLCADWENYAPVIESVFSSSPDSEGYIPVTVAGKTAGDSPFFQSFRDLLSFRENRFEADAVFNLLEIPAIRKKYELDEEASDVLRDMIGMANIRWGYDDADVRRILGPDSEKNTEHYPFTWQRGLDRMVSEFLYGSNEDGHTILKIGGIGEIRPCGSVEGDRAKILYSLWKFVQDLKWLRETFAPDMELLPDDIQQNLLKVIRKFYDESNDDMLKETNRLRQIIRNTAESMKIAGIDKTVCAEVFLASVQSAFSGSIPGMRKAGDSVQFAPLNCSAAVPHQLVWICGLNDGAFPNVTYRASYDLIGKHPSLFDATSREKDAFALLKAVLSSRKQLCFSYVGKDNHTNDDIPSSVLLTDLKDYFSDAEIGYTEYRHPMNGYSQNYFTTGPEMSLPPTYSSINYDVAKILSQKKDPATHMTPFPLSDESVTEIDLNDLIEFFSGPNQFLFRRGNIYVSDSRYSSINSKECMHAELERTLQKDLVMNGQCDERSARNQVEMGSAPDVDSAKKKIQEVALIHDRPFSFRGKSAYTCKSVLLAEAFQKLQEREKTDQDKQEIPVDLTVGKHSVLLHQRYSTIVLDCVKGMQKFMMFYEPYHHDDKKAKNRALIRYLGANAAEGGIAAVLFGPCEKPRAILLPELSADKAKEILAEVITLAGTPLPHGIPDYRNTSFKKDELPPEWQAKMDALYALSREEKE